jgi:hypothetical protein
MRRVTLFVLAALATFAEPQPRAAVAQDPAGLSPRNANYRLNATLDPASHSITGAGHLVWRNTSRNATSELQFHLYWNAWRDTRSSWMREQALGRSAGLTKRPVEDFGNIDVTSIAIGGVNLVTRATFIAPDDGNADDRTVLRVPLDTPAQPGQTIQVELQWTARVPRTFARTGRLGDYYFIAQWFPKIGVLEDAGWNCHQFHAATEFFSDFGTYDVTLMVPTGWIVGATGRFEAAATSGAMTAHRYVQADVHDFAWTTSPAFLDQRARFQEPGLPPVNMRLLLQPEHADQADRHFAAARATLKYYGTWFGAYPYDQITIVDPATIFDSAQGESTGGMEYPTLFTAGTRWYIPWGGTQPESVTVHEAGHQFWYGMVATNEFENAWMDEGFNTYSTARVMDEAYPGRFIAVERFFGGLMAWSYKDVRWSRDIDGNRLNAFRPVASYDMQSTPTWQYWPGSASAISYNKTALWLGTLERLLGWPTTQKILATHFSRGAFRHPTPAEFFAIANEVSGRDLTWFFDAVHRSSATFDYGVAGVASTPREGGTFDHVITIRRFGDGAFPTITRITFTDGSTVDEPWDGRDRWRSFPLSRNARIAKVEVDPDRVLLLDVNYTNNTWSATPRAAEAAGRWSMRWLTWVQEMMLTYAFFS